MTSGRYCRSRLAEGSLRRHLIIVLRHQLRACNTEESSAAVAVPDAQHRTGAVVHVPINSKSPARSGGDTDAEVSVPEAQRDFPNDRPRRDLRRCPTVGSACPFIALTSMQGCSA